MLNNLAIKGFRTFEEYTIEDLGRVNLFVGRNNSGKTTILEAAEMLLAPDSSAAVVRPAIRRGEMHLQEKERTRQFADISHLMHAHTCEPGAKFRIAGTESGIPLWLVCEVYLAKNLPGPTLTSPPEDDTLEQWLALYINHQRSAEEPIALSMTSSGAIALDTIRMRSPRPNHQEKPVSFVRTEAIDSSELQKFWDAIALTDEESNVVESLQMLDPRIDRLAFLSSKPYGRYRNSSSGIYVKLQGVEGRIPIGSLGDGIRHLLTLSLAVIRSRHGFVMIDEIDTGLHHSVMSDMWRVIIGTAERLDVQIFATTHSLDCVRSLAWLANTQPDLCRDVRVHRVDSERPSTVVYSPSEISTAAAQHVELRG